MSVYKGIRLEIGAPVGGHAGIRNGANPEELTALAAELRVARDKARHGITQAFEAREQSVDVEARLQLAMRKNKNTVRRTN